LFSFYSADKTPLRVRTANVALELRKASKAVGTVRVLRQEFALEDGIAFHAFASLEALPCV
jgi:hypothetical protein